MTVVIRYTLDHYYHLFNLIICIMIHKTMFGLQQAIRGEMVKQCNILIITYYLYCKNMLINIYIILFAFIQSSFIHCTDR